MIIANQRISENLKYSEVRCRCGGRCDGGHLRWEIAMIFERIRRRCSEIAGKEIPIFINSGVRCELHNTMVGGSKNSFHMKGMALDLRTPQDFGLEMFAQVCNEENPSGGVITYSWGCHVDARGSRYRESKE